MARGGGFGHRVSDRRKCRDAFESAATYRQYSGRGLATAASPHYWHKCGKRRFSCRPKRRVNNIRRKVGDVPKVIEMAEFPCTLRSFAAKLGCCGAKRPGWWMEEFNLSGGGCPVSGAGAVGDWKGLTFSGAWTRYAFVSRRAGNSGMAFSHHPPRAAAPWRRRFLVGPGGHLTATGHGPDPPRDSSSMLYAGRSRGKGRMGASRAPIG
jgi:hypothetical protein